MALLTYHVNGTSSILHKCLCEAMLTSSDCQNITNGEQYA